MPRVNKVTLTKSDQAIQDLKKTKETELERLVTALETAETKRAESLDQLSDRLVALQNPDSFVLDLLSLTKKKMGELQGVEKDNTITQTIDSVVEVLEIVGSWEIPMISPESAMGCLPM